MQVRDLDRRHPSYDAERLQQLTALYEGGAAWHALKATWLPGGSVEPRPLCEERRARARYTNYLATILDLITSQLFGEPPALVAKGTEADTDPDAEPEADLEEAAADIDAIADGSTQPFASVARLAFADALLTGRAWALVDLPAASQAEYANRADQERAGATKAYLRRIAPASVINWRLHGARPEWVVVREDFDDQPDPLAPPERVARFTVIDRSRIRTYEARKRHTDGAAPTIGPDDPVTQTADIAHGRTDADDAALCPVVLLELPTGLAAGLKLLDPAANLCRQENEADWGLWRSASELLVVRDPQMDGSAPILGHGYYLHLRSSDAEAYYIGPSGTALDLLLQRLKELRGELYRVVQQMALAADPTASRIEASAASKAQDWSASDRMLTSYADELRNFLSECVRQALAVRLNRTVTPEEIDVAGLDGWQRETTDAFLAQIAAAVEAKMSPTFLRVAAQEQARRVLGDAATPAEHALIASEIGDAAQGLAMPTGMGAQPMGGTDGTSGDGTASSGSTGDPSGQGGGAGDPAAGRGRRRARGRAGDARSGGGSARSRGSREGAAGG